MKMHNDNPEQFPNPSKLADDAVLALSSLERGSKVTPEVLKEGIKLCDYLIHLIGELKAPQVQKDRWTFRAIRDDSIALTESGIDIDKAYEKTEQVKKWISDLIEDPLSHSREEIESIKEHLINVTMPMWQSRTSEFRDRKMKRSLIIRG
jgi:hypothetical protein